MMGVFFVGLIILGVGIAMLATSSSQPQNRAALIGLGILGVLLGPILVVASTAIYVADNQGGVVVVKFGKDLPPGSIIATNGEKGPQAYVLPPGYHFFYWPWIYELESVNNVEIERGYVGVVLAKDGADLPEGEIYAQEWESTKEMLDGYNFLTSGKGQKGPQLTVLTPGQYRYNPRLFDIEAKPAVTVKVGEVAVVKANAGKRFDGITEKVNGVPMVPNGYRGIWDTALIPDQYYMHPDAYEIIHVMTTNRIYSYTETRDGAQGNCNKYCTYH